jgi:hypothetical protein
MKNDSEALVYSGAVIEFVAVAREVCSFLEQADGFAKPVFMDKTRKILPLLYYKAAMLPSTEALLEDGPERFVTEREWQTVHDTILNKLGKHNDYPEVIDPVIRDTEDKVGGSIAENLADIYQDLKDFIMVYRMGTVELMNDALWECMQHFEQEWGQKLLNCLRALHNLLYGGEDLEDVEEDYDRGTDPGQGTGKWIFSQRQKLWNEDEE